VGLVLQTQTVAMARTQYWLLLQQLAELGEVVFLAPRPETAALGALARQGVLGQDHRPALVALVEHHLLPELLLFTQAVVVVDTRRVA
jgi:hypothetical protein